MLLEALALLVADNTPVELLIAGDGDDTVGRERRILRARYQLVDLETGAILLDATAGSDAGIDVVSSEYATIAAEQTALENLSRDIAGRMATQIALTLRKSQ